MMNQTAYLILENGTIFQGKAFGAIRKTVGETVFTTAMTGYLETLTDPSHYGQIVVQTFPLIGNYGMIPSDFENPIPHLKAYIVREWCQEPSNFRCEGTLDAFLNAHNIPGIFHLDTRELTKNIREQGVMNGALVYDLQNVEAVLAELKGYRVSSAVQAVSCKEAEVATPPTVRHRVVLWDFGTKRNIRRELLRRDCEVVTLPAGSSAEEILQYDPSGILLSNGPGDPAQNTGIIRELSTLSKSGVPIFGICLGHQLLALSQGGQTQKLKYGHRGANQPVKDLKTGRVRITSQNHGYAVLPDSLPEHAALSEINVNDGSCEGIAYLDRPMFSVQYHPEGSAGPLDTMSLFDRFIDLMKERQ